MHSACIPLALFQKNVYLCIAEKCVPGIIRLSRMLLSQWLIEQYGVDVGTLGSDLSGSDLASAVHSALVRCGRSYDDQRAILHAAARHHADVDFGEACLDRVDRIAALQRRLASTVVPPVECHSTSSVREPRPPAQPVAALRFEAGWSVNAATLGAVADFCHDLVAKGYVAARPGVEVDLRQGFGYFASADDPLRQRAPVAWLHYQNELRYLVRLLLGRTPPLCRMGGGPRCWEVTVSLFTDARGRAFRTSNLDHGEPPPDSRRRDIDALVPRHPQRK